MINKAGGEILTNLLMRVHDRRQQYLYTGFFTEETRLLLGSGQEADLKFGDPDQTAAILAITDPAYVELLQEFCAHFQIAPAQQPMQIFSLRKIFAALMKAKWDLTKVTVTLHAESGVRLLQAEGEEAPGVYGMPIASHFTYMRLRHAIGALMIGLDGTTGHCDVPIGLDLLDSGNYVKLTLDPAKYADTALKAVITKRRPLLLAKGRDLLTPKKLVETKDAERPHVNALRLWSPGGRELCYAGYFEMPGYAILSGRLNLFLT